MKTKSHKSVKFSDAEVAYDGPSAKELLRGRSIGRGPAALFAKPKLGAATVGDLIKAKETVVRLDPDVAKVFKSSKAVNEALRKQISSGGARRRRKSA